MKHNEGFTLIELLIAIAAGSLVTLAAVSLLLLGTRVQHGSAADVQEQQQVRIVLTLLEETIGSGEIGAVRTTYDGWELLASGSEQVRFAYAAPEQTLYSGTAAAGTPLLTGLHDAAVTAENGLLTLMLETARGEGYTTKAFCRTGVTEMSAVTDAVLEELVAQQSEAAGALRLAFLETLAGEYAGGGNTGEIQNPIPTEDGTYQYYSQWYVGGYEGNPGWDRDTPWCACFVSWAAVRSGVLPPDSPLLFADVDKGMTAFQDPVKGGAWKEGTAVPIPGDYVFFDWPGAGKEADHVGVVLDVRSEGGTDYIYTIEGNSSGRVAVRKYPAGMKTILGYGILPSFRESGVE